MTTVEPKPEFQHLSEDTVLKALEDPASPIAVEVARLLSGYAANFQEHVERLGYVPTALLRIKARWPIEAVTMRIMTNAIRKSVGEKA